MQCITNIMNRNAFQLLPANQNLKCSVPSSCIWDFGFTFPSDLPNQSVWIIIQK